MRQMWMKGTVAVLAAAAMVVGSVGVAPRASAAPEDWSISTTWDLRPYGGVDYGLVLQGPGSDLKAWMEDANPLVTATGGITAILAFFNPPAAGVMTGWAGLTTAQFQWCAQTPQTKVYVTVIMTFVEDGHYTFWDRLFGRVKYREVQNWFLTGCDRVG